MGAVWARVRAEGRSRWAAWLAIAVLVGLAGGVVTSIVAGGSRTDSAYRRFLAQARPSDVWVLDSSDYGFSGRIDLREVENLPAVASTAHAEPLFLASGEAGGRTIDYADLLPIMSMDGSYGTELDRRTIIDGRPANPARPYEAVVGAEAVERLGIGVGDVVRLDLLPTEDFLLLSTRYVEGLIDRLAGRDDRSAFDAVLDPEAGIDLVPFEFTIVGISVSPGELPPLSGNDQPFLHLTPAFADEIGQEMTHQDALYVRLEPDATISGFKRQVERVAGEGNVAYSYTREDQEEAVERTLHLQALALWALAVLVGISAALILGQLLSRQARAEAIDDSRLRSLGFTSGQLLGVDAVRVGFQAVVAGAASLVIGVLVAPIWSFGLAAVADIDDRVVVDADIHLLGAMATAGFLFVVGGVAGWWVSRRTARPRRATRRQPALAAGLLPPPLAFGLGVRQALDAGRGDRSVPVRSAVFAVGTGIAAFVVAATFNASLTRLLDDPDLYGWTWDVQIGSIGSPDISEYILAGLGQNESIGDVSAGTLAQVDLEGVRADAYALDDVGAGVQPLLLEGRVPENEDEIVLGTTTLRELEADLGDEVYVGVGGLAERMRVVGRAVFPSFGDQGQLGIGARITLGGLQSLDEQPVRNVYLVRFEDGVDAEAAAQDLDRALDPYRVAGPKPPEDLSNLADADRVPVMAGFTLGLLAVATLAHALLTAARRRRREVGALRSMGFRQRQVLGTFAGQATVLAIGALVVGIPIGVAVGRWAWIQVADEYGFPAEPVVPWAALGALAIAVPIIAVAVALGPGLLAARARTAEILRAE